VEGRGKEGEGNGKRKEGRGKGGKEREGICRTNVKLFPTRAKMPLPVRICVHTSVFSNRRMNGSFVFAQLTGLTSKHTDHGTCDV